MAFPLQPEEVALLQSDVASPLQPELALPLQPDVALLQVHCWCSPTNRLTRWLSVGRGGRV